MAAPVKQKTLQTNVQRTTSSGAVQTGRIVERADGKKVFLIGNTKNPSSGSGASAPSSQGSPGGSVYDNLSPSEAMSYANLMGEASAVTPGITKDQVDAEKTRLQGIQSPYYDAVRNQLNVSEATQKQQYKVSREQISDNYDDALKQLKEQYNRRGLLFSGQELNEEARTGRDKANALTSSDLNLQNTLAELGTKRTELTLKEQQNLESQLQQFITSQTSINEGVGKANAKAISANLATQLLSGIGSRLEGEKNATAAEKSERSRIAQSAEERAVASLFGQYQGQPTLAGINNLMAQERLRMDQEYQPYKLASAARSGRSGGSGSGVGDPYGRYQNITSEIAERYNLPYSTSKQDYDTVRLIINRQIDNGWSGAAADLKASGYNPTDYDEMLWQKFTGTTKRAYFSSKRSGSGDSDNGNPYRYEPN